MHNNKTIVVTISPLTKLVVVVTVVALAQLHSKMGSGKKKRQQAAKNRHMKELDELRNSFATGM